jgi:hypothetical protein
LAFEQDFDNWFGFAARSIYQTVELNVPTGEYTRLIWGDFRQPTVEAALSKAGYVALEQYNGTRLYTLRDGPTLLNSLALYAASPADGVLLLSNQAVNLRLTLDVWSGRFSSNLQQYPEMRAMMRALGDVTNLSLIRYWNNQAAGLVCGLPAYKTEAFANVQRDEGWQFIYALGFSPPLEEAESHRRALAGALENSDYPLRGPGSQTFGEVSEVVESWAVNEGGATILLVSFRLSLNEQEASFFGQEIAQAALSPCALGDTAE